MNPSNSSGKSAPRSLQLPLSIQTDQDLRVLVQCFRRICMIEPLRKSFLDGIIDLDVRLAATTSFNQESPPSAGDVTKAIPSTGSSYEIDETVVTEVVLRRHWNNTPRQSLILKSNAIVTPLARDYAKEKGIRLECDRL